MSVTPRSFAAAVASLGMITVAAAEPVHVDRVAPRYVFGSGPEVIGAGARLGDRVTVTVGAEPERVEWAVQTARQARVAAGLDPDGLDVGAFVVVGVGTDEGALDELVRGNASISAHFQRGATASLPRGDAAVVAEVSAHYDTYHHGLEHAAQSSILDAQFLRRFCVIGAGGRTARSADQDRPVAHHGRERVSRAGRLGAAALRPPRRHGGASRAAGAVTGPGCQSHSRTVTARNLGSRARVEDLRAACRARRPEVARRSTAAVRRRAELPQPSSRVECRIGREAAPARGTRLTESVR